MLMTDISSTKQMLRLISLVSSRCGATLGRAEYHSQGRKPKHSWATVSSSDTCPRRNAKRHLSRA